MQQWEYLVRSMPEGYQFTLKYWLDRHGEDGWGLCGRDGEKFIFKRSKDTDEWKPIPEQEIKIK